MAYSNDGFKITGIGLPPKSGNQRLHLVLIINLMLAFAEHAKGYPFKQLPDMKQ